MNFPDPDIALLYIEDAQQGTERMGKGEETYGRYFQQPKKHQTISG